MKNIIFLFTGLLLTFTIYTLYGFIYQPSDIPQKEITIAQTKKTIQIPTAQDDKNQTLFVISNKESKKPIETPIPSEIKNPIGDDDTDELSPEEIIKKENELYDKKTDIIVLIKAKKQNNIFSSSYLLTAKRAKGKMKIKAKIKDGVVKVKVMFTSLMVEQEEAEKKKIQSDYITYILARVKNKVVFETTTSGFMSENPLLKFSFTGAKKGDEIEFILINNNNEIQEGKKKIK